MKQITIRRPDNYHVHLREGIVMEHVLPYTSQIFGRAMVMTNTDPVKDTVSRVLQYKKQIMSSSQNKHFQPLMTIMLTRNTTPEIIEEAYDAGFMYVKQSLCEELEPSFWSYINIDRGPGISGMAKFPFGAKDHDSVKTYDYPFPKNAQRFEPGTTATDELWGWHAALKWLNELGKENIEKWNLRIGLYLSEELESIGLKIQTPSDPEPDTLNTHRHVLTMYTTGDYEKDMQTIQYCKQRPVRPVRGPTMKYQAGFGGVRVSPHFYNTFEEIDLYIETLKEALRKL